MGEKKRFVRMTLALLFGVFTAVEAWGWEKDQTGSWSYEAIAQGKTCRIRPAEKKTVKGAVAIPATLTPKNGVGKLIVTEIGDEAFSGCSGMTALTLPEGVTKIGNEALAGCSGLTTLSLPSSLQTIGQSAFTYCSGLSSVTLPVGLQKIGGGAFIGCTSLTGVRVPASVEDIGPKAFAGCTKLRAIEVDGANENYLSKDGVLFDKDCTKLIKYPSGMQGAFSIPEGVTMIVEEAFSECVGLEGVTIPGSMTIVGAMAFSGCTGLKVVTIPAGVTVIGKKAFSGCHGLQAINVDVKNTKYLSVEGVLYSNDKTQLIIYPGGKSGAYETLGGVVEIVEGAFAGCEGLAEVTIGHGVKEIGISAFEGCTGLRAVTFPEDIEAIGEYAFAKCAGLKVALIPGGLKEMGEYAFAECTKLKAVRIPEGVVQLGEGAFKSCPELSVVRWQAAANVQVGKDAFRNAKPQKTLCVGRGRTMEFKDLGWVKENGFTVSEANMVVFDANGGKFSDGGDINIMLQDAKTKLNRDDVEAPSRANRAFVEWVKEGATEGFTFGAAIEEDLKLVARWDRYEVKFVARGGAGDPIAGAEVKVGSITEHTGKDGEAVLLLPHGKHEYTLSMTGYGTKSGSFTVQDKDGLRVEVLLAQPAPVIPAPAPRPDAVESELLGAVRVVQNPIVDLLVLEGTDEADRVEVYTLSGKLVFLYTPYGEGRVEIPSHGWQSGVYVARIVARDGERGLRVVKR